METKWDLRFLALAEHISRWSKDTTKVGAVIADPFRRIISCGFNGYPVLVSDNDTDSNETKLEKVLHAEENAILFAKQNVESCTLYCTRLPCSRCAAHIIQAGITCVIVPGPAPYVEETATGWRKSVKTGLDMFEEAYVTVRCVGPNQRTWFLPWGLDYDED